MTENEKKPLQTPDDAPSFLPEALPVYRSHKLVRAAKILSIDAHTDGSATMSIELDGGSFAPINVSKDYVAKHAPKHGGYFVLYADGYCSWSPAEAFESGYAREKNVSVKQLLNEARVLINELQHADFSTELYIVDEHISSAVNVLETFAHPTKQDG